MQMAPSIIPRWLIGVVLGFFGLLLLTALIGSLAPRSARYAELAQQLNTPETVGQVQFDAGDDGNLLVYIDVAWRSSPPADQQRFALGVAQRWADMTGNPSALVTLGDGHGTCFAIAMARSRVDGQPFYRAVDVTVNNP